MLRSPKRPPSLIPGLAAAVVMVAITDAVPISDQTVPVHNSSWSVVSEGSNHFEISLTVPPPRILPSRLGAKDASRLELEGWTSSAAEGAPMLPLRSYAVAVPEGEEYEITVEGEEPVSFSGVLLIPFWRGLFTEPRPDSVPERAASNLQYSTNEFLPHALYKVGPPTYLRDLRLVPIDVCPARYNPATGELRVFRRLRIRLETRGGGEVGSVRRTFGNVPPGEEMWEEVYRSAAINYPSEMAQRAFRSRGASPRKASDNYFTSSNRWLAAKVSSRGMYKITYQDILDSGVPEAELDALDPATLRLFNGGGLPIDVEKSHEESPSWMTECAIQVEDGGDGGLDPGDMVIFYGLGACGWQDYIEGAPSWGLHFENSHTDHNVYWLTWGGDFKGGPPLRMEARDGEPAGDGVFTPGTYRTRVHYEENRFWEAAPWEEDVKWERWWWQELAMGDPFARVYTADLHDVSTSEPCRLKARFWGSQFVWGCLPHHVLRLEFNGSGVFFRERQLNRRIDIDTTAVWAAEGKNKLVVRVEKMEDECLDPPTSRKDKSLFAWFELEYYRDFRAVADELAFDWIDETGGPTRFEAHGFSSDAVRIFDVTERYLPGVITTSAGSGGSVSFQEQIEGPRTNYYLVSDAALRTPTEITLRSPGGLRTSSEVPDYIIVTGPELIGAANVLADWRRNHLCGITDEGLAAAVEVADISDIYDEFSWGMLDPLAIRSFLEFRFENAPAGRRPPSYVLLLGEATRDFKNVYGLGVKNIVPAWDENYDWRSRTQYSSDDFFVLFEGPEDRYADMAIGRITAEGAAEAMEIVTGKVIGFEREGDRGPWRNNVVLAADDACKGTETEGYGERHTDQADDLSKFYLPLALDRTKIFMIDYGGPGCQWASKPAARADFIKALNLGAVVVNYVGHGSAGKISDETLFLADDVAALNNERRLGLFITASCAVGKYDVPLEVGIAEGLMRHPSRGSLASYAATTLAYIPPNKELDELLIEALLPRTSPVDSVRAAPVKALGLAVMEAEAAFGTWEYFTPYKYVLLGDPASVIGGPGTPYYNDGSWMWVDLEMNAPDLAGGERDTLKGAVMADDGVATSFQGQVSVLVQGARVTKYLPRYGPYYYPGPTFYRGETEVVNGRFELSWVNPYEVQTGEQGRVRAFVWNDRAEGTGALTGLEISPPSKPPDDTEGPVIEMSFETSGGVVTPGTPLLIKVGDPSGVNMAPVLAENGLFLRLYNEDLGRLVDGPVDLVEGFTYERGSSSFGSVVYRLPAGLSTEEGANTYRVELNASDNFSNRSSMEMTFDLVAAESLRLTDVINFPNPFSDATTISFRVLKEADVVVKVYTVGGRRVRTLRSFGVNGWGHVKWDGRDEEGEEVSSGVYLYKVTAVSTGGGREKADAVGKAAVIR